jgi:hypothetical protein
VSFLAPRTQSYLTVGVIHHQKITLLLLSDLTNSM